MFLIVGLGNPGRKYQMTRHNIGVAIADILRSKISGKWKTDKKLNALVSKLPAQNAILIFPQTFMNASGIAVQKAMQKYKILTENVWVICDDVNLEVGYIRVRRGGESGGHNGLKSLIANVGADFWRIRVGVGICANKDLEQFVLEKFSKDEWDKFKIIIDKLVTKLVKWIDSKEIKEITWDLN